MSYALSTKVEDYNKILKRREGLRMSQIADRIYRNAKIYSVALDGTETHAQALAIKDGKFVYVGD